MILSHCRSRGTNTSVSNFTSTVTTGADYNYDPKSDIPPIEAVFLFPYHNSCTPRDMCQMAGRIRYIALGNIYVALADDVTVSTTTRAKIVATYVDKLKELQGCSANLTSLLQISTSMLKYTLPPDILARSYRQTPHEMLVIAAYSRAERSFTRSNQAWMSMYVYLSKKEGYTQRYDSEQLSEEEHIEIAMFLKKCSQNTKAEAVKMMNAIDVQGFRESAKAFRQLKHLASGLHLKKEDSEQFHAKFPIYGTKELKMALKKATAARLFQTMPLEEIDAEFVNLVHCHKQALEIHHMHTHLTTVKLVDFLMVMHQ
jgi:hypothetical protein